MLLFIFYLLWRSFMNERRVVEGKKDAPRLNSAVSYVSHRAGAISWTCTACVRAKGWEGTSLNSPRNTAAATAAAVPAAAVGASAAAAAKLYRIVTPLRLPMHVCGTQD